MTYIGCDAFGDGQTKAYANVDIELNIQPILAQQVPGQYYYMLEIEPSSDYDIGTNSTFTMDIIITVQPD